MLRHGLLLIRQKTGGRAKREIRRSDKKTAKATVGAIGKK